MTGRGPVPVEEDREIYPDYDHYIEKQIDPIIDSINATLHLKKEDKQKQTSLTDFL